MRDTCRQLVRRYEWWLLHRLLLIFGNVFFWFLGRRSKSSRIDLKQIKRVLVVRLDEIGDIVLTTPFLRELRRNLPAASITLLVSTRTRNLVELCPYVDEVISFKLPGPGVSRSIRAIGRGLRLGRETLWTKHFDLAIAPRWDHDSYYGSMLTYLSGAPHRIGYSERVTDEKGRLNPGLDRLLTHCMGDTAVKHEVEIGLDLIRSLGGEILDDRLEIWGDEEDEFFAKRFLRDHGVQNDTILLAVSPGAGQSRRMWPISNFVELANYLLKNYSCMVLVMGSEQEISLSREIRLSLGSRVINTAGRTTLRQAAALLKRCALFVGNDAGPMHLAAAAGLPTVEISCHPKDGAPAHTNSPVRFAPWGVKHTIVRPERSLAPCSAGCTSDQSHCIRGVSVQQVQQAVENLYRVSLPTLTVSHPATISHHA